MDWKGNARQAARMVLGFSLGKALCLETDDTNSPATVILGGQWGLGEDVAAEAFGMLS